MDISATGSVGTQEKGSKLYCHLPNIEIQVTVGNGIASKAQFLPVKKGREGLTPFDIAKDFNAVQAMLASLLDIGSVSSMWENQHADIDTMRSSLSIGIDQQINGFKGTFQKVLG